MTSPDSKPVWFITGCSTGFGRELALLTLSLGYPTVVTARNPKQVEDIVRGHEETALSLPLDVTKEDQVLSAVDAAVRRFGRIDVLVNNAGYGLEGAMEELTLDQYRAQFDVNVFGAVSVMKAVLPVMRAQKSGHIVNITSMGGLTAFPGLSAYHGSKFALEGISESLAKETAHLGIRVTIVEPGSFRTNWAGRSMAHPENIIPDYAPSSGAFRGSLVQRNGRQRNDPTQGGTRHRAGGREPPTSVAPPFGRGRPGAGGGKARKPAEGNRPMGLCFHEH
jgi:NAD(P)-dependent dehydrogenase (short-subunit alcohol dehydrogenase family)